MGGVQRSSRSAPGFSPRRRVLVADDHQTLRGMIAEALRAEGFQVDEVSSGEAALECLRDDDHCAAVLDVRMPGIDGMAVAAAIRDQALRCTPIVVSAVADDETRRRAAVLGAPFHQKPFQLDALLHDVRSACEDEPALP